MTTTQGVTTTTVDRILKYLEENGPSKKAHVIRYGSSNFYQGRTAIAWMLDKGLIALNNDAECEIVRSCNSRHL